MFNFFSSHSYGRTLRLSLRIILCYLWNILSVTIMDNLSNKKKTVFKISQRKCRSLRNSKWVIRFWWTISVSFLLYFRFRWSAYSFPMLFTKSRKGKIIIKTRYYLQKERRTKLKEKRSLMLTHKNNMKMNNKKKATFLMQTKSNKKYCNKSYHRNWICFSIFCFTMGFMIYETISIYGLKQLISQ